MVALRGVVLLSLAFVSAGASPAAVQVVDLGHLGGSAYPTYVYGYGRDGRAVGSSRGSDGLYRPYAWTLAGGLVKLSDLEGAAWSASPNGHVVGSVYDNGRNVAFRWTSAGGFQSLATGNEWESWARVVNANGDVAGELTTLTGEKHAFLKKNGGALQDLGSLGGSTLTVTAINASGWIAGYATLATGQTRGFYRKGSGPLKAMNTLGGNDSYATAMNDDGRAVGYSHTAAGQLHAFRLDLPGPSTQLKDLGVSGESFAQDVNAAGQVVGWAYTAGGTRPFLWSDAGGTFEIPVTGGGRAVSINNSGVVGLVGTDSGGRDRAYVWTGGVVKDIGTDDDESSAALGVATNGSVIATRVDWNGNTQGFLWTPPDTRAHVGGLGGGQSFATHINAGGQVTGQSLTAAGYLRPFLYTPGSGMTEIVLPARNHGMPKDLNDAGQIAGEYYLKDFVDQRGFFWSSAGFVDLGRGSVAAMNNLGQVVGTQSDFPSRAYVWSEAAGFTTITAPVGVSPLPTDINDTGRVCGFAYQFSTVRAFTWTAAGGYVDLGDLGGGQADAVAINNSNKIVGRSLHTSGNNRAFAWTPAGGMVGLGHLGGGSSEATGLNGNGHVIGLSNTTAGEWHAFLRDGSMRDLGTLGGVFSWPLSVNNTREVVGWSYDAAGASRPFLWSLGAGMTDLGTLGGALGEARSINASGQAAGKSQLENQEMHATLWITR